MPQLELQELIDANDQPFVVIDREYRIVAANRRYSATYGVTTDAIVGQLCHVVSHHSPRPCHKNGEQCPHQALFEHGEAVEVLHTHFHADDQPERTRIRGHALRGTNGERYLGEQLYPLEADAGTECDAMRMVGKSPAFLACVDNLARVADCEAPILLFGESGVGKELAARFIHARSQRAGGAFIVINCAAVPENLFESELFGHERGAFSGSSGLKKGLFELADGGTLFLDEVAEIPLGLQAKLLRVLETGLYRRVGGVEPLRADFRLVGATHRNLQEMVKTGQFRQDLYFRISTFPLVIPPLRERREDLPLLIRSLLERIAPGRGLELSPEALACLISYNFPGNIRELRNMLERASILADGKNILPEHLPDACPDESPAVSASSMPFEGVVSLEVMEKRYLRWALDRLPPSRREQAHALGVSERTLFRKIENLGEKD